MRIFFVVILAVMLAATRGMAQEEDNVATATSALQDVLLNLKQTVDRLGFDNNQLMARDNAIKRQVVQLQQQLGQLEAQGDGLNKAAGKLQVDNPGRTKQMARLQQEDALLDDRAQNAHEAIKVVQQSLDAEYQEEQKLLAPKPQTAAAHQEKEKLKLMKMIYESQQRQEALHEAILEFQNNTPLLPAAGALAHQQLLKEQIKDLESQIAASGSESPTINLKPTNQLDPSQLQEMESELKSLEQNYAQLKGLMEQMDKKAQGVPLTVSQHIEEQKLHGNLDDLNRQGTGLMAQLDDLRTQMVDLDKRKSSLETMVQQL